MAAIYVIAIITTLGGADGAVGPWFGIVLIAVGAIAGILFVHRRRRNH